MEALCGGADEALRGGGLQAGDGDRVEMAEAGAGLGEALEGPVVAELDVDERGSAGEQGGVDALGREAKRLEPAELAPAENQQVRGGARSGGGQAGLEARAALLTCGSVIRGVSVGRPSTASWTLPTTPPRRLAPAITTTRSRMARPARGPGRRGGDDRRGRGGLPGGEAAVTAAGSSAARVEVAVTGGGESAANGEAAVATGGSAGGGVATGGGPAGDGVATGGGPAGHARLGLVGVDGHVLGARRLGDEAPLGAGREARRHRDRAIPRL